jgi:hypothetical protein
MDSDYELRKKLRLLYERQPLPELKLKDNWKCGYINAENAIYRQNRFAKKKYGGSFTIQDWLLIKEKQGGCCLLCNQKEPSIKLCIDHIISQKHWLKWSKENNPTYKCNDKENIQALCFVCNSIKSYRIRTGDNYDEKYLKR